MWIPLVMGLGMAFFSVPGEYTTAAAAAAAAAAAVAAATDYLRIASDRYDTPHTRAGFLPRTALPRRMGCVRRGRAVVDGALRMVIGEQRPGQLGRGLATPGYCTVRGLFDKHARHLDTAPGACLVLVSRNPPHLHRVSISRVDFESRCGFL